MRRLLLTFLGLVGILFSGISCSAQDEASFKIPRYPINLEGVIQDVNSNPVNNVTLHVRTEYPLALYTEEYERKHYRLNVNSPFRVQLNPGAFSMTIVAEKEGYARSSGYAFDEEQLAAKDVVIRLIPAVRPSKLESGLGHCEITTQGKSSGFSFRDCREMPLKVKPLPTDMCIYLEVTGTPKSFEETNAYSVAIVGAGVEFREAFLLPLLKYTWPSFRCEMLQAPEDGYVSRIEVKTIDDLENRYFYFRTREGRYGKLHIDSIDASDRLLAGFDYYYQPDGTRDLAQE